MKLSKLAKQGIVENAGNATVYFSSLEMTFTKEELQRRKELRKQCLKGDKQ